MSKTTGGSSYRTPVLCSRFIISIIVLLLKMHIQFTNACYFHIFDGKWCSPCIPIWLRNSMRNLYRKVLRIRFIYFNNLPHLELSWSFAMNLKLKILSSKSYLGIFYGIFIKHIFSIQKNIKHILRKFREIERKRVKENKLKWENSLPFSFGCRKFQCEMVSTCM